MEDVPKGWKRETTEALTRRLGLLIGEETAIRLRKAAAVEGVSSSEMARILILEGLDRLDRPSPEPGSSAPAKPTPAKRSSGRTF